MGLDLAQFLMLCGECLFDQAFNSTEHLNNIFDVLGPLPPIGHANDQITGNSLVTHLDESVPGDGLLDYTTSLT
ncbi:MAG: hypothetical protein VYA69_01865 [Gemmatimonadota bacterium]|nr:hypothetical protein [Gemmatimonadota bacterium]